MKKYLCSIFIIFLYGYQISVYSSESPWLNAFYTDRSDVSSIIESNHNKINVIISQAYFTNKNNEFSGSINIKTVAAARKYDIPVIAQATNHLFDLSLAHTFLLDEKKQDKFISDLIIRCKNNQLSGIQLDFEHIDIADKKLLNNFIIKLSKLLHKNNLKLYVAVIPPLAPSLVNKFYEKRYQYWSGVYDLKTIARYADYVDLMTYDQHGDFTPPGPIAGYTWVNFVIQYALKYVPKQKLLVGIPSYSGYWQLGQYYYSTDKSIGVNKGDQVSYRTVQKLLKKYHPKIYWDDIGKLHFAVFSQNNLYRYIFIEDAESMVILKKLSQKYRVAGVAIFRIGTEDPAIWKKF
jgi:spore germination protein YaaH